MITKALQDRLAERHHQSRYRMRRVLETAQGPRVAVDGREYLLFCSNDYLGLANHPKLITAMQEAAQQYGVGGGASHLVCGHSSLHHQLELRLAEITGRDRALLFSTGYMANLGAITALISKGDHIIEDRLNHASLLDAALLSGAKFQRFHHNDLDDLERRLQKLPPTGNRLLVVDAVFSMDGDIAPLDELAVLAKKYDAYLMADDAHGFGVLGGAGAGSAEVFNLDQQQLPVLMGTLGKGIGSYGAFIAGDELLIESLIQFARPYIYTTAMPPAVAAASLASLELLSAESWRRDHLQALIQQFKRGAQDLGLPLMPSNTAIQPLLVGDEALAMTISANLDMEGVLVSAIRPPTVAIGQSRLRITLTAAHSADDIATLLAALDKTVPVELRIAAQYK
ncbi:8-amino-7-oxononanoate synthase [Zhongshania aliphaticivorans]|uniref:8-amino-7-oxononanoate synthase n=1 Tax=Zhongshania aliphaticivorans TaxID=1470434 RepID=A0A5S9NUQ1_9GAMM|nr:8-amino-7-oxononanoate synthase [Zhongshania aliphaticivorans]CAA0094421.1 8-amino-7-oxononanoate synthase [Zhongshania aliphaticivorans]CAA0112470.1 8-amino-7-oxononanoate synthase [Zhongshania aliphaticivorans]